MKRWSEIKQLFVSSRLGTLSMILLLSSCGQAQRDAKTTGGETHFLTCVTDSDCSTLSSSYRCVEGTCRAETGSFASESDGGGSRGSGGAPGCPPEAVPGPEVLVLGDTFMALTHGITTELENVARKRGTLPQDQRYRDASTIVDNALAYGGIASQYARAIADAPARIIIMDGGGSDILQASCDAPLEDCPAIVAAVDGATHLFERMAADGVNHVVYAYYPDPAIPAVRDMVDAMRPLMQAACEKSSTPCHWVDLRSAFAGHYADYVADDGLDPTTAGSQASALAISDVMQRHCVAQ